MNRSLFGDADHQKHKQSAGGTRPRIMKKVNK
jgi:hypothetical protein